MRIFFGVFGGAIGLAIGLVVGAAFEKDVVRAAVTLLGVALGWFLGAGWDQIKKNREKVCMKQMLRDELAINLYMVPQKRDALQNMLRALEDKRILAGDTTGFCNTAYKTCYPAVADEMKVVERISYHWLYEKFRIVDSMMRAFAPELKAANEKQWPLLSQMWLGHLADLIENTVLLEDITRRHLDGKPVDVLHTAKALEDIQKAKFGSAVDTQHH